MSGVQWPVNVSDFGAAVGFYSPEQVSGLAAAYFASWKWRAASDSIAEGGRILPARAYHFSRPTR